MPISRILGLTVVVLSLPACRARLPEEVPHCRPKVARATIDLPELGASTIAPTIGSAEPEAERRAAIGRRLMDEGNSPAAIIEFDRALLLGGGRELLFDLATAYRHLNDDVAVRAIVRTYLTGPVEGEREPMARR